MIEKTEISQHNEFYLIGISIRTSNQNGQSGADIGALWTGFINDDLIHQIPGKLSEDIYCVYTDYESDHNGFYTAVLGCKVNSLDNIPGGFNGIIIPGGKYQACYLSGKFPKKIIEAWQEIWQSNIERSYIADYDLYIADSKSPEETDVQIYLSVR